MKNLKMSLPDCALMAEWRRAKAVEAVGRFKGWLEDSGRGYLSEGLGSLPPGVAFREIFKRAGITEISAADDVLATLPKAMKLIEQRCPPRARNVQ